MIKFQVRDDRLPVKMIKLAKDLTGRHSSWGRKKGYTLFPAKDIDTVLMLLNAGLSEDVSILDWLKLLDNKEDWDSSKTDQEIANSSVAVFKASCTDHSILQLILSRAATHLDDPKSQPFPGSLFNHLDVLRNHLTGYWEIMLEIVIAARDKQFDRIALAAAENWLTPGELFDELNLPTCTSLKDKTDQQIPGVLRGCNEENLFGWFPKLISMGEVYQEFSIIEGLLHNKHVSSIEKHRELYNWLEEHCSPASTSGYWSKFDTHCRRVISDLIDLANYGRIKRLASALISDGPAREMKLEDWELRQIKSRSIFWQHYSDSMLSVRILVPSKTIDLLERFQKHTGFQPEKVEILEATQLSMGDQELEMIVMEFENFFIIDALRGSHGTIRCYQRTFNMRERFIRRCFSMRDVLTTPLHAYHDHTFGWQVSAETWLRQQLEITPNSGTKKFSGLPPDQAYYDPKIGLPKPSKEDQEERITKLQSWQRGFYFEEERYRS